MIHPLDKDKIYDYYSSIRRLRKTELTGNMRHEFVASAEAAEILGISHAGARRLCRRGRVSGEKIANRWLIPKDVVEEFAKRYEGRRGKPRTKRKYTKRSEIWNRK